jgi:hypothetical protein
MNDYFVQQAGSGLSGFEGVRFQKGHGFFGRLVSGGIMPLLKKVLPYLGRQTLDAASDFANEIKSGTDFVSAAKKVGKRKLSQIAEDALVQVKNFGQSGNGKKRKKKKAKITNKNLLAKCMKLVSKSKKTKNKKKKKKVGVGKISLKVKPNKNQDMSKFLF